MTDRILAEVRTRYYAVRMPGRSEWARIWITDDGCFTTLSDYGDYGYWWGAPGCEFRKFLTGISDDYLIGKLAGGKRELNVARTETAVKELILRKRRERLLSNEQAEAELQRLRETDFDHEGSRQYWYENTNLGEGANDVLRYEPPMQVQMFVKHLWPLFVEKLKAELVAESA